MLSIFSPLEQFRCLPLITVDIGHFTVTVCSNITAAAFLCFSFFLFFFYYFSNIKKKVLYVVPTRIQLIFEFCFFMVYDLIKANVGPSALPFFPYIFTFFLFTISSNVTGLAPYGYTITSHIIITFSLAIWFFFGVTIINYKRNQKNVGQIFLPPESALILAFLLVPIELVSFLFRPLSLAVRLFANMMAGHALLKVISLFAWTMINSTLFYQLASMGPIIVIFLLFFLELGVALIQAYVFTILICIYLNDALNLH